MPKFPPVVLRPLPIKVKSVKHPWDIPAMTAEEWERLYGE